MRAFISNSSMRSNSERIHQLNEFNELFGPIERSIRLPLTDLCYQAELYDESPELLVSICSIYYFNRLLLHASMVPVLSDCCVESPDSSESVQYNSWMVLQLAIEFSELLQQFIAKDLDITKLWPFAGHVAFVTGNLFLVCTSQHK